LLFESHYLPHQPLHAQKNNNNQHVVVGQSPKVKRLCEMRDDDRNKGDVEMVDADCIVVGHAYHENLWYVKQQVAYCSQRHAFIQTN